MTVTDLGLEMSLEQHRRELTAHCRRMLRSPFEAEDAVQETLVRAWRAFDRFEGRSAVRSWLHRIATNVCLDMLRRRRRQPLPMDPTDAGSAARAPALAPAPRLAASAAGPEPAVAGHRPGAVPAGEGWGWPSAGRAGAPTVRGPEEVAMDREATRQAFVALLQLLPPRQRTVLILHEVLRWRAAEVAELLGTTVPAVNSALQRARATIAARAEAATASPVPTDPGQRHLLARYVDAFERADVHSLVALAQPGAPTSPVAHLDG